MLMRWFDGGAGTTPDKHEHKTIFDCSETCSLPFNVNAQTGDGQQRRRRRRQVIVKKNQRTTENDTLAVVCKFVVLCYARYQGVFAPEATARGRLAQNRDRRSEVVCMNCAAAQRVRCVIRACINSPACAAAVSCARLSRLGRLSTLLLLTFKVFAMLVDAHNNVCVQCASRSTS